MSMKQNPTVPYLTHATGEPVSDNLNIQTAGPRGPALLQDIWLIEKLAHFDREVIPERRMHAKGAGAHGTFTVTHDIRRYTKAKIFAEVGKQTPMFARFSTVAGERGAADAERDIRGFALKFYSEEGNWDVVGNNTPVFFFRDPLRFPDLNHAVKRDPRTGMRSTDNNWDFWTLLPEALHRVTIVMSDRGIDLTKVWPKAAFPLIEVGFFELNRNPENFFAEVEQAAFSPANIVPGIGFSPDKVLQARLFSYGDTQRYRLGVNFNHIPVNAPKCPFHSYHRDGAMRTDGNLGRTPSYFPNSRGEWADQPQFNEPSLVIEGAAAHWDHRVDDDHYQQPGELFRKMNAAERQALFDNTARQIGAAAKPIQERHIANCTKADSAYGAGVAQALARTGQTSSADDRKIA
jgi:catalase